jgi:two-component system, NtrC family, sensor histidine kinase KinB
MEVIEESKAFVKRTFLVLFGVGLFLLLVIALVPGDKMFQHTVLGLGIVLLGYVHIVAVRRTLHLVETRVSRTERILEANYAKELQEYTEKLEQETQKLQETSDFLNSILDSSTEYSIITTGRDGKITLFNQGAERLIGYTAEEVVGKETPLLFLRSPSKSFAQVGVQIMKHGVDEGEWQVVRKDGQTLTVIFTMTPMKNRDGQMLGFLGIAKDITEQKALEKQIQDYTENLEKIVEKRTAELERKNVELDAERQTAENRAQELDAINKLSQAITSTIELEDVLSAGAKRVVELLHVTQSRLFLIKEGTEHMQSVYKYDKNTQRGELNSVSAPLSRYPDFLKAINTKTPVIIEDVQNSSMAPEVKRVFEKQGVYSILNLPLLSTDTAIGIMMLLHTGEYRNFSPEEVNLAETVSSQLAVALKNAQLFRHVVEEKGRIEALVNSSGDGILMTDNRFHIILMNAVAAQLFELEADQFHGRHLVEFVDAQKDNLKDYELVKRIVYQIVTTPETTVTEEFSLVSPPKILKIIGNPVLGDKNDVIGHMIVLHDITQEKQLEQMRDDLISMIVHDLKNPLAGVIGFSEILLAKAKQRGMDDFEGWLTKILYQANTLHDMVNNILEVHKMEDGSMELQKEVAELDDIIASAVKQVEMSAKQKDITISTELSPDLSPIFVDKAKVVRLFANILSNGIKYTPEQGNIYIHTQTHGDEIITGIQDTGKGIPTEYLATIFDRFAQIDRKKQGKMASVGLGLYFCKLVVESHGGTIWAESEEGKGSTFYFTIPNLFSSGNEAEIVTL